MTNEKIKEILDRCNGRFGWVQIHIDTEENYLLMPLTDLIELLEKQIPKKRIFSHNLSDTISVFHCECGNTIKVSHDAGIMNNNNAPNYCSKCGCRLDWSNAE